MYNKHSGEMVGFTNLGSINDHLADFERSLTRGHESNLSLTKTMVVFMVRGLFTSLQFPYVHFACTNLCGDQMYDPLWEAIWRRKLWAEGTHVFILCGNQQCIYCIHVGVGTDIRWCFCEQEFSETSPVAN